MWQAIKKFYHQLGSPREFYRISAYFVPVFGIACLSLFLVGAYWGLVVAPADYQQGDSFRIIYVHVPAAWMSLFVYVVMAVAGAIGLIWRMKMAFVIMISSASIGAIFLYIGIIALYSAFSDRKMAEKAASILCIVGVINIPIIHYSVEWWNSLHQGATVIREGGPAMPASMLYPLLIMALAFKLYYGWLVLVKARTQVLIQEQNSQWVKELAASRKSH